MNKYLVVLIFWCSLSSAVELVSPILKPDVIIENAESYLTKEKAISVEKYQLKSISFNFYNLQDKTTGTWILNYICKPINGIQTTDCGFTIRVDNSLKPKFEYRSINV